MTFLNIHTPAMKRLALNKKTIEDDLTHIPDVSKQRYESPSSYKKGMYNHLFDGSFKKYDNCIDYDKNNNKYIFKTHPLRIKEHKDYETLVTLHCPYFKHNGIVGEIGVHTGRHAKKMWYVTKPKKLFLIDPWEGIYSFWSHTTKIGNRDNYVKRWDEENVLENDKEKYQHIDNNSYTKMSNRVKNMKKYHNGEIHIMRNRSNDVVNKFPNNYFDWLVVDGAHDYENVKLDLNNYLPKMKNGSVILCDDYFQNSGTVAAINEFLHKNNFEAKFYPRATEVHIFITK
jgi:hypothetical protein